MVIGCWCMISRDHRHFPFSQNVLLEISVTFRVKLKWFFGPSKLAIALVDQKYVCDGPMVTQEDK